MYSNCRYENCLSVLKKLVELRREDARVTHNKAVAQYLLSNLTKTDEFRRTLESVEAQFEHDAKGGGSEGMSPISVTEYLRGDCLVGPLIMEEEEDVGIRKGTGVALTTWTSTRLSSIRYFSCEFGFLLSDWSVSCEAPPTSQEH